MTASKANGTPKAILLATDLSVRSDRALERSALLAKHWNAQLTILHVLERTDPASQMLDDLPSWRRPVDPLALARKNILADLDELDTAAIVAIEEGAPAETIARVAEQRGIDMILIGVARNELLGQFNLGRTVDELLRNSKTPILVVKERAKRSYRNIVVATDFSASSRHALEAALRCFPNDNLTLFHAYNPPMSGLMTDPESYRRDYRAIAEQECADFLQEVEKRSTVWRRPQIQIEYGPPSELLRDLAATNGTDLIVLGSHGRSALFEVVIGSVAKRMIDEVPCDALVIREPQAAA